MKCCLAIILPLLTVAKLQAASNTGFGLDAFNRAVSAATRVNAVFSPFSFEIDSVVFSEATDVLTRAKLAETMGVLNGLEFVYHPLYEEMIKAEQKSFVFLDARGFCLPDERKMNPVYRQWMQKTFAVEAFTFSRNSGSESWFRSRMDGEMEGFILQPDAAPLGMYSYYDLVFARFPWQDPFPTNNTRKLSFHLDDGNSTIISAFCDLRMGAVWERRNYSAIRLPLSDGVYFFALLPNQNVRVRDIRGELTSSKLNDLVCGFKSITEYGISHGSVAVVIPKMDITFESDLKLPFEYFRFPIKGMERMPKDAKARYLRQCVRFQLDERGVGNRYIAEKDDKDLVKSTDRTKRFILNRPFLFFILHEPTAAIPIAGQFMGR